MIIGQVMHSFGSGGAQRSAINLALGLSEIGHESRIVALGEPGGFALQVSDRIPCDSLGVSRRSQAIAHLHCFRNLIHTRGFDVLHVHGSGVLPVVAAAVGGEGAVPSLYFTWHDSENVLGGSWWKHLMTRWALGRCKSVFGSSAAVAMRLQSAWGGGSVHVMRNGVPDCGVLGEPTSSSPTVVWAARIVPEKRPDWFIRTAAVARDAGLRARFVLAGSPLPRHQRYFDSIRMLAADLADPVEFAGWVERTESLYKGAAIGVQTSATEGLSMVLLEQMMAGMAIVATNVGDTAVALEGGKAGVLVDSADEASFAAAVLALLVTPHRRMVLAEAARARAIDNYSCRAVAEQFLPYYVEGLA